MTCARFSRPSSLANHAGTRALSDIRSRAPLTRKVGQGYANQLRRQRPKPTDKRQPDKVSLAVHGERHSFRRAVDQDGYVFDILEQHPRNQKVAKKYSRKLLEGLA